MGDSKWYMAKIVGRKLDNSTPSYLIHYCGWNNQWDEWICDVDRIEKGSNDKKICKRMLEEKRNECHHQKLIKNKTDFMKKKESVKKHGIVKILSLPRQIRECLLSQHELIGNDAMLLIELPKPSKLCIKNICSQFVKFQSNTNEQVESFGGKIIFATSYWLSHSFFQ